MMRILKKLKKSSGYPYVYWHSRHGKYQSVKAVKIACGIYKNVWGGFASTPQEAFVKLQKALKIFFKKHPEIPSFVLRKKKQTYRKTNLAK